MYLIIKITLPPSSMVSDWSILLFTLHYLHPQWYLIGQSYYSHYITSVLSGIWLVYLIIHITLPPSSMVSDWSILLFTLHYLHPRRYLIGLSYWSHDLTFILGGIWLFYLIGHMTLPSSSVVSDWSVGRSGGADISNAMDCTNLSSSHNISSSSGRTSGIVRSEWSLS